MQATAAPFIPACGIASMATSDFVQFHQQIDQNCGSCGMACTWAQFCSGCNSATCNICMDGEETVCLRCQHFASSPLLEKTCDNCGVGCGACAHKCYSCDSTVCSSCMVEEEGSCVPCLGTFPVSPRSTLSPSRSRSTTGSSEIWQQTTIDVEKALPLETLVTPVIEAPAYTPRMEIMDSLQAPHSPTCNRCPIHNGGAVSPKSTEVGSGNASCCDEESDAEQEVTTMMICNIPCRLSQDDVIEAIHSVGFAGMYDFVYLPDRKRRATGARTFGNIGYAFVNFKCAQTAESFITAFENFRFQGTHSAKRCTVKYAERQGYNANENPSSRNARLIW